MSITSYLNAALEDDADAVNLHLAFEFAPDLLIPDQRGGELSILHLVTSKGCAKVTMALLAAGANPDILDSNGDTPMKMAIVNGHKLIVELLFAYGARADLRISRGETYLHVAYGSRQTEIALLLEKLGVDPDIPDDLGFPARNYKALLDMKAAGWDTSKPNEGASLIENIKAMSEDGLRAFYKVQLPLILEFRKKSGEIDDARFLALNALMAEVEQALNLPEAIISTRMNEINAKVIAILETSSTYHRDDS